jgi:hypothetical protein
LPEAGRHEEAFDANHNARQNIKYYEERIKTLEENIRQGGII